MKASIVVPSYNASERLYYNLLSINMQDYNREDFEVIVVDNGSTDGTSEVLSCFNANFKLDIFNLNKNMGRAFARNCGAKKAKGEIIIFHDSDMIAEKDFVAKHIYAHQSRNTAVCGQNWCRLYSFYYEDFKGYLMRNLQTKHAEKDILKINALCHKTPLITEEDVTSGKCFEAAFNLTKMFEAEKKILDHYGNELEGFCFPWSLLVTNNCSIEKELFTKVDGFDDGFVGWGCEDLDLGYRLYRYGCKFIKRNDIKSVHQEHPINFVDKGEDNIFYFTKKYDSSDLLLFYYGYLTEVDRDMANRIMKEIDKTKQTRVNGILEVYRRLLVVLRDKNKTAKGMNLDCFDEMKHLKYEILLHRKEYLTVLTTMENEGRYPYFHNSFNLLMKKVFNRNLETLK